MLFIWDNKPVPDGEELIKQLHSLRKAIEDIAAILPMGHTCRERDCWEVVARFEAK